MAVSEFFRWLNDAYGLNFSIFYDPYDRDRFLLGLWTTLYLSVVCIVFSIVIGVFGACLQGARSAVLRALLQGYVQLFRTRRRWCSSCSSISAWGPRSVR